MNEPIKKGDRCEVVWGAEGAKSPNRGLIVIVLAAQGEHSFYGPIWLCEGDAERAMEGTRNVPLGQAHFAQSWLKKLPPEAPKAKTVDKEITA